MSYEQIFQAITADPRYQRNLDWGKPRPGHPEGTVRAHIEELEKNLNVLCESRDDPQYWRLRILIHVHDSFKAEAISGVAITDPRSHASRARSFLAEFCTDQDLLSMVQLHDEPYALWRQSLRSGLSEARVRRMIGAIRDWKLFLRFQVIDGTTKGKSTEPRQWIASHIAPAVGLEQEMRDDMARLATRTGPRGYTPQISRIIGMR